MVEPESVRRLAFVLVAVKGCGVQAGSKPLLKVLWGACALLLLVAAGVVYAQGRSAAALHSESVEAARVEVAQEGATGEAPPRSSGPSTGATASTDATATPRSSTGPGVDAPGTTISARVATPTVIDVSESLILADEVTSVTIAPPSVGGAAKDLASVTPVLTGVQVTAEGQVIPVLEDRISAPMRIDLPVAARTIEVRYLLEGGIVRTVPSKAGRALAGLAPVMAAAASLPVSYVFGGDEIIGVSCPQLGPTAFACAGGQPGRLAVTSPVPRSQSVALLQLNLPRP